MKPFYSIIDIKRQLSGTAVDDEKAGGSSDQRLYATGADLSSRETTHMANIPLIRSWVAMSERRCGRDLTILFLSRRWTVPLRGRRKRTTPSDGFNEEQAAIIARLAKVICEAPRLSPQDILLQETEQYIRKAKKPQRCFQCYTMAISCSPSIVEWRNGVNTSQPWDTFERSIWAIGNVTWMTKIFYIRSSETRSRDSSSFNVILSVIPSSFFALSFLSQGRSKAMIIFYQF